MGIQEFIDVLYEKPLARQATVQVRDQSQSLLDLLFFAVLRLSFCNRLRASSALWKLTTRFRCS